MKIFSQNVFRITTLLFALLLSGLNSVKSQTTTTYSTAGTTSWTVPACVTSITVQAFGGGGGGGGAIAIVRNSGAGTEACSGAGGGGGGGYTSMVIAVTPGQVYNIVVGAGGTAGTSGAGTWSGISTFPTSGGTGGTSSFTGPGATLNANGGNGGVFAAGYNTNTSAIDLNTVGAGGSGGVGSGGTVNFTGGAGSSGYIAGSFSNDFSGPGGGAAGPGGNGGANTPPYTVVVDPPGGIGQAPGGNGANGRYNIQPGTQQKNGYNGNAFGGGGGGGLAHKDPFDMARATGGSGAVGAVIVRYSAPASPGITSVTSPTITCASPTVQSAITYTNGATTFTWTGPAIVSGSNTGTVSVNGTGIYSYTASVGGCSSTGTVQVQSNTAYPSVAATAPATLNCTNTTVQAIATTTTTPVTYNWTGPNVTGGATTATATVGAPGTYNYSVTAAGGCVTSGTIAVSQNTSVVTASTTASSSLNCTTTSAQIIATTTVSPVSYNWSGTGITSGAGTATINVNQGGTFNYTITNTNDGCKTIGSQTVTQNNTLPNPTATSPNSITCLTTTVALNGGPSALTYTWSGPGFSGGTNSQDAVASASGSYTLSVTGANGCTNTVVTTVNTNTTLPGATAILGTSITCTSATATLQGGPLAGVTYSWSGVGLTGATTLANATATTTGNYTLTTTSTVNGCTNTAVATVTDNLSTPQISVASDLIINCVVPTATLIGSSTTPGVTYAWTGPAIGAPAGSTPTNSTSVVNTGGNYTLTLTNPSNGCINTGIVSVISNTISPTITASNTTTLTCLTTTAQLTGTGVGAYSWSGPGIIAGGSTSTPTVNLPGT
ncbi:MAG: hypothetical protein KAZ71_06250, partial [Bacteroidia bacterium]|nr:hypothetical protein [Bacteroidia bacterium]